MEAAEARLKRARLRSHELEIMSVTSWVESETRMMNGKYRNLNDGHQNWTDYILTLAVDGTSSTCFRGPFGTSLQIPQHGSTPINDLYTFCELCG